MKQAEQRKRMQALATLACSIYFRFIPEILQTVKTLQDMDDDNNADDEKAIAILRDFSENIRADKNISALMPFAVGCLIQNASFMKSDLDIH